MELTSLTNQKDFSKFKFCSDSPLPDSTQMGLFGAIAGVACMGAGLVVATAGAVTGAVPLIAAGSSMVTAGPYIVGFSGPV